MSLGSRSLPPPTPDEKAREAAGRASGCEACNQLGLPRADHCGVFEQHHFKVGGYRVGHRHTVILGRWHHQGYARTGRSKDAMRDKYGTNLAESPGDFHAQFGSDQALQNSHDDRIGWPRVEIRQRRERDPLRSKTSRPAKILPPRLP